MGRAHDCTGSLQEAGDQAEIRGCDCSAYMKLPWSDCYRANTVNRSQSILRDLRVQAVARKDKLSNSHGRS